MKNIRIQLRFTVLFLVMGAAFFSTPKAGADWKIETVESSGDVGDHSSMALDASMNPHMIFKKGNDLGYAYYDGNSWNKGPTIDPKTEIRHTSIALDSLNNAHISYFRLDLTNLAKDVRYAYYDGNSWEIEILDTTGSLGGYTSLALDSNDNAHISYYDSNNSDLKYAYHDTTGWHVEIVDDMVNPGGGYTSLALDSSNNPHISYYDSNNSDLKYAYHDTAGWHIEIVDDMDNPGGGFTSLALDSENNPHISYYDPDISGLKYAYFDGNRWDFHNIDANSQAGFYSSIALDSSNNPHIGFFDANNFNLKYAYHNAAGWYIETIDSEGDVGEYASIALDSSDIPHISYYDASKRDLKYTYFDLPTPGASADSICFITTASLTRLNTNPLGIPKRKDFSPDI